MTGVTGGGGQRDHFFTAHAVQKHRHGEGANLGIANAVIGNALYKRFDLFRRQRLVISLKANQLLGQQRVLGCVGRH